MKLAAVADVLVEVHESGSNGGEMMERNMSMSRRMIAGTGHGENLGATVKGAIRAQKPKAKKCPKCQSLLGGT